MEWIKMKYELPENGQRVLIYDDYYKNIWICFFCKNEQYFVCSPQDGINFIFSVNRVSNWMPLPNTPQEDNL